MKKTVSAEKLLKSIVPLVLVVTLLFSSAYPISVHADTPVFSGMEDAEVEENQPFDLLSGVSAVSTDGAALPVTVNQVICNGEPMEPTAEITAGPAGTTYLVEYLAASGTEASDTHTAQRTIVSISAPNTDGTTFDPDLGDSAANPENPHADTTVLPEPSVQPTGPNDGLSGKEETEPGDEATEMQPQSPGAADSEAMPEGSASDAEAQDAENAAASGELMTQTELPIQFKDGLHYVTDPQYPDDPILLYCMNNNLAWPHSTGEHPKVPNYTEGYLTPENFDSQAEYDEFIAKLRKILFAGFPYNGERLYMIVSDGEDHKPTENEFNNMLILPPQLEPDFPNLGHHKYTLDDVSNPKHYEELIEFIGKVRALRPDKTTTNGLTYDDITSMPFYKAVFSMTSSGAQATKDDVLNAFAAWYPNSYFVTEKQAYDATNLAVWKLMYDYGIEHNDISFLENNSLSATLYQYCQRGDLLDHAPDPNQIYVEGDLSFSYNPEDGKWHSGKLKIINPPEYNGLYHLDLPEGMTVICENATYVYANEEYELVSATQPQEGDQFRFYATIDWLQDMKQYSPINSAEFQNMVGALVRETQVSQTLSYSADPVGSVEIMKVVKGNANDQNTEFSFVMTVNNPNTDEPITGAYGDLFFDNGVAEFTLKSGEMKVASHLPSGATYSITEENNQDFHVAYSNAEGVVPINNSTRVTIKNTKLNSLSISKTVQGEMGDKTKPFHFDITLKTANGVPLDGSYPCIISSVSDTAEPIEETLIFTEGKATVTLTHGQKAQLNEIPYGCIYTVKEQEANQDGYLTTYTGTFGVLRESTEIQVVNQKEAVPPTGIGDSGMGGMIAVVCLAAIGLTLPLFYSGLRRKRGHYHG